MFIENVSVHKRDEDHEDNEDLFKVNQTIEYIDLLNDLTMAAVASHGILYPSQDV